MMADRLRIGFMPLIDAAIPLAAAAKGFDARHGLRLDLVRETSWANIRDRLAVGHFEAAHLLAPMPVAAALGLTAFGAPLIAPMALGLGGNAVTVSTPLWNEMRVHAPHVIVNDARSTGAALAAVVAARRAAQAPRLVFGVVHPWSAHNYELRYWLAACSIAPDLDVEIAIAPPPSMPAALAEGNVDGFCVGEPWSSVAAARAGGRILLTKNAIWRASPEKALGLRADWARAHPDLVDRLLQSMIDAAIWCGEPGHRDELAGILSAALGVEPACVAPSLQGQLRMADGSLLADPAFLTFERGAANFPWANHAVWFAEQMVRWGQATPRDDLRARARACCRPDLYRAACAARGHNAPTVDSRPTGRASAPGLLGPLDLPANGFFDEPALDEMSVN